MMTLASFENRQCHDWLHWYTPVQSGVKVWDCMIGQLLALQCSEMDVAHVTARFALHRRQHC